MLTAAGSGYSRWGEMAITRWREDATRDDSGSYIFLRDMRSGVVWSAGFQPTGAEPDEYSVDFNEDRVEITRRDGALTTKLEMLVSAEDDAEVRGCRSRIRAAGRAKSRSHPMPNSLWGRKAPMSLIPPSRSCSSRPNIWRTSARSSRRGESGLRRNPKYGRRI